MIVRPCGSSIIVGIIASIIKDIIAISLVMLWIAILSKLKSWIFRKEIKS